MFIKYYFQTIQNEKLKIVNKNHIYNSKSRASSFRIEIDDYFDVWFKNEKYCLYFAVDAFTDFVLNLWIEKEKTNARKTSLIIVNYNTTPKLTTAADVTINRLIIVNYNTTPKPRNVRNF